MEMQAGLPALRRICSGNRRALAGRAVWSQGPSGSMREDRCRWGAKLAAGRPGAASSLIYLGHGEGAVQEDQRSAMTDSPVQGARLPLLTGETAVPLPRGGPDSCAVAGIPCLEPSLALYPSFSSKC